MYEGIEEFVELEWVYNYFPEEPTLVFHWDPCYMRCLDAAIRVNVSQWIEEYYQLFEREKQ